MFELKFHLFYCYISAMKAFLNYYRTLTIFNLCFSLLVSLGSYSPLWFPVTFCTAGFIFSLFAFGYYYKPQYYFYHNLGYTKKKLAIMTFVANISISAVL